MARAAVASAGALSGNQAENTMFLLTGARAAVIVYQNFVQQLQLRLGDRQVVQADTGFDFGRGWQNQQRPNPVDAPGWAMQVRQKALRPRTGSTSAGWSLRGGTAPRSA